MLKIGDRVKSNNFGWVEVVSEAYPRGATKRASKVDVRFDDTGRIRTGVLVEAFLRGSVRDGSVPTSELLDGRQFVTTNFGLVSILEHRHSKDVLIEFEDTGNKQSCQLENILTGLIVDDKVVEEQRKTAAEKDAERKAAWEELLGKQQAKREMLKMKAAERKAKVAENNRLEAERMALLEQQRNDRALNNETGIVECTTVGYRDVVAKDTAKGVLDIDFKDRNGLWVLRYRDPSNNSFVQTRLGKLHNNMTQRANKEGSHQMKHTPSYIGVSVSDEFSNAQAFCDWVVEQPGWELGFQLDKDLLINGNREYSSEACCFIPGVINQVIKVKKDTKWSQIQRMASGKWKVTLNANNKSLSVGEYDTQEQGIQEYKEYRRKYVCKLAEEYKAHISDAAYFALLRWNF